MAAFILRRLGFTVFVLWGAITLVFVVMRVIPGDPALVILGPEATAVEVAALRAEMGLDEPILLQYIVYLGQALRLDFGESIRLGGDAMTRVLERLPMTMMLALSAFALAIVAGMVLGTVSALRSGRVIDKVITGMTLVTQSLPKFWIGLILILLLSRGLNLLPSGGADSPAHYIMPVFTLSLGFMALVTRLTRSGLLEVMNQGYIDTARSKGLPEWRVVMPHALRNTLIPLVTVMGLQFGGILGGSAVLETVFSWPGVGRLIIDSIGFRDYGVVQAGVLLFAANFAIANLIVDVLYGYLDPRVRARN